MFHSGQFKSAMLLFTGALILCGPQAFAKHKHDVETKLYQCRNIGSSDYATQTRAFQISVVNTDPKKPEKGYYKLTLMDGNGNPLKVIKLYNLSLGIFGDDATSGTYLRNVDGRDKLILHRNHSFINGEPDKVDIQIDYKTSMIEKFDIRQTVWETSKIPAKDNVLPGDTLRIPAKNESRSSYSCADLRTGTEIDPPAANAPQETTTASTSRSLRTAK